MRLRNMRQNVGMETTAAPNISWTDTLTYNRDSSTARQTDSVRAGSRAELYTGYSLDYRQSSVLGYRSPNCAAEVLLRATTSGSLASVSSEQKRQGTGILLEVDPQRRYSPFVQHFVRRSVRSEERMPFHVSYGDHVLLFRIPDLCGSLRIQRSDYSVRNSPGSGCRGLDEAVLASLDWHRTLGPVPRMHSVLLLRWPRTPERSSYRSRYELCHGVAVGFGPRCPNFVSS
ncbi:hypothetical protein AXG93_523s1090 [Marchantia polymorpha subsp. ruderalis]|uniref:Uncharacterized protein n=1 Tax=Marchantia polymorpha subsp. ruderalis TaxID=1480154 RepID=A0A176VXX9_MARPO|nr:hypothetical protein AXG93_523s1090 [Marchantia polymorpha subsp. ruderalis]